MAILQTEPQIGTEAVAGDDPMEASSQKEACHLATARAIDVKEGSCGRDHDPQPGFLALFAPTGFIHVGVVFAHMVPKFLDHRIGGRRRPLFQITNRSGTEGNAENIVAQGFDLAFAQPISTTQKRQQRLQARSLMTHRHAVRQGGARQSATAWTAQAVQQIIDHVRFDFGQLQNLMAQGIRISTSQFMATAAAVFRLQNRGLVGRQQRSFLLFVPRLATPFFSGRLSRRSPLHVGSITGRWFGGIVRVFCSRRAVRAATCCSRAAIFLWSESR